MAKEFIEINLNISSAELQRYYCGEVANVIAVARDGRKIQFPAVELRKFVSQDGICGDFVIEIDSNNKLINICQKDV